MQEVRIALNITPGQERVVVDGVYSGWVARVVSLEDDMATKLADDKGLSERCHAVASAAAEEALHGRTPHAWLRVAYEDYAMAKTLGDGELIGRTMQALKEGLGIRGMIAEKQALDEAAAASELSHYAQIVDTKLGMVR